jgi:peptide chain release factor 3
MQFEVASHRLEHEFGAPTELSPTTWRVARKTDEASTPDLRAMHGVAVYARADGTRYALFESPYWLARVEADHPGLTLDRLVAEGSVG